MLNRKVNTWHLHRENSKGRTPEDAVRCMKLGGRKVERGVGKKKKEQWSLNSGKHSYFCVGITRRARNRVSNFHVKKGDKRRCIGMTILDGKKCGEGSPGGKSTKR